VKKLITVILLLAGMNVANATVDTGTWLLEFSNGWKVTMNMDNFGRPSHGHTNQVNIHGGGGVNNTNFIDIDTGNAATTILHTPTTVPLPDRFDNATIINYADTTIDSIFIRDSRETVNSSQSNRLQFGDGLFNQVTFTATHSFFDSLVDLIDVNAWTASGSKIVNNSLVYNTQTSDVALTSVSAVPVPGAVWLMGTALIGLVTRRKAN
jgi:hypothetical protein